MKKMLKNLFHLIKSYFLQGLLAFLGIVSFEELSALTYQSKTAIGEIGYNYLGDDWEEYTEAVPLDVAITSGYNGAAIGMGLVCSVCIVMIVWIEIKKTSHE